MSPDEWVPVGEVKTRDERIVDIPAHPCSLDPSMSLRSSRVWVSWRTGHIPTSWNSLPRVFVVFIHGIVSHNIINLRGFSSYICIRAAILVVALLRAASYQICNEFPR